MIPTATIPSSFATQRSVTRRGIRVVLLSALTAAVLQAAAAGTGVSPEQEADWQARLARAEAMQREGNEKKAAAEKRQDEEMNACYRKFFVNRCRDNVHDDYVDAVREARRIRNEGLSIERQVKKEQLSARDLQAAAEMPEREAELQAREAETRAARETAAAEEAAKRAEKAKQAEAGAQRKAHEAERLRRKQAEHEARIAAQAADGATKQP